MHIKKNIWTAFYLIVFVFSSLFIALSYAKFLDLKKAHINEHENFTKIISQHTQSILKQEEILLELLGLQLLENNAYLNVKSTTALFDRLLKENPSLAAFGLIDIEGRFLAVSSNLEMKKLNSLMNSQYTRSTFTDALQSQSMILGRTYFFSSLKQWVIPLRKAIRDEEGTVIGVMTTGLKIDDKDGLFNKLKLPDNKLITIIKDIRPSYRQFTKDTKKISKEEIYNVAVPKKVFKDVREIVKAKYGLTLHELKSLDKVVSIEVKDSWNRKTFGSISYNKDYALWIIVESDASLFMQSYMRIILIYLGLFLFSLGVISSLFLYISKAGKEKEAELEHQVGHDSLTGLPNRRYLEKNIRKWEKKFGNSYEVLFIDLDNFKNINDNYGHKIGDEILIEVAARFQGFFKEEALIARHGGDEFIILTPSYELLEKEVLLIGLIDLISRPYLISDIEFHIGSSIGTAHCPSDAKELHELMSLADIAMYEAKKKKNSFCIFSQEMKSSILRQAEIESELRLAVQKEELWMVYQPQINADGSLYGVEALVRWENKKLGFVPPDEFIKVAEATGLMVGLGEYILQQSLVEIKKIQDISGGCGCDFKLSINISVRQLIDVNFLEYLLASLKLYRFDVSTLTLEITESLFIEDIDYVLPILQKIQKEGIELSLDDFGTGYSSLSMLRKLPVNELKIDKSFVDEVLNDSADAALVQSIISMGKNLNMHTVAEGTQTLEQVDILKQFGCDIFQGYYFSKPLKSDDLLEFLKEL